MGKKGWGFLLCFVFPKLVKLYILRYAEQEILLACLMKYLTELEVWFPDIIIEALASDEHLCVRGENVTRCFISFLYQTLGLSFNAVALFHARFLKKKTKKKINHMFHPRIVRAQLLRLFLPDVFVYTSEVWRLTREPRSTGNFHLYLPIKKQDKSVTIAKPPLCVFFFFFAVVSPTLHGNKPHPAEAGVCKSVGLINGHLKRPPLVFRWARSCVSSTLPPFRGRLTLFVFAWLLVQDLPLLLVSFIRNPWAEPLTQMYRVQGRGQHACVWEGLVGGSGPRLLTWSNASGPLPDWADLLYRIWVPAL